MATTVHHYVTRLHVDRHIPSGKWALSWLDNNLIGCGAEGETSRKLFDTVLEAANYGQKTYGEWPLQLVGLRSVTVYSSNETVYDLAVRAAIEATDALTIIRNIETHSRTPSDETIEEARKLTEDAAKHLEEAARQIRLATHARKLRST